MVWLIRAVQGKCPVGCVPENSTYGGVNVAENTPSCVVFAHRLVPDQWDDKRFMLDAVEIFFFCCRKQCKALEGAAQASGVTTPEIKVALNAMD